MRINEFLIEEQLETLRPLSKFNFGESGVKSLSFLEIRKLLGITMEDLDNLSLADSSNLGNRELRKAISKLYPKTSSENIIITTGTGEALFLIFQTLLNQKSKVSVLFPAFQALYELPRYFGAKVRFIDVWEKNCIEKLFSGNSNFIIINHPHNPTGRILRNEEIKLIEEKSKTFNGILLFDEHYRFLDFNQELSWSGGLLNEKTFAIGSITKCFGVPGLRIGWIIAEESSINQIRKLKDYITHTVNPISEFITLKFLENRKKIQKIHVNNIIKNITNFRNFKDQLPGISNFYSPEGGVVGFPQLKKGLKSEEYCNRLFSELGIFVLPGKSFEMEGYIRVGFGEEQKVFQKGLHLWQGLKGVKKA